MKIQEGKPGAIHADMRTTEACWVLAASDLETMGEEPDHVAILLPEFEGKMFGLELKSRQDVDDFIGMVAQCRDRVWPVS